MDKGGQPAGKGGQPMGKGGQLAVRNAQPAVNEIKGMQKSITFMPELTNVLLPVNAIIRLIKYDLP